jgi:hypothetical protein
MLEDIFEEEVQIALKSMRDEERLETLGLRRPLGALPTLQPVIEIAPSASVRAAIDTMKRERLSCVLIVEQGQLVGVLTAGAQPARYPGRGVRPISGGGSYHDYADHMGQVASGHMG